MINIHQIEQDYYTEPTLGKALILQGAIMTTWVGEDNIEEDVGEKK